ncbi:potassium channel subfamily K member 18-like [Planococcus citri]|uniref:potassium channel subfamily K member 18-like n=1 Tax=Planococcus citri TaxID=170843 RepID=UPI0031FA1835
MKRVAPHREPTPLGKCLRKLFRISFSNIGTLVIVFVYLIFGGFLFKFLENQKQIDSRVYFQKYRDECIQELWSITKSAFVLYKQNWTLDALDPIKKFEANVVKEITINRKLLTPSWSYMDSFFYSVTILTTIGCNNYTPNTSFGKLATVVYATFGVPLMLLCICNLGVKLSDLLQFGQLNKNTYYSESNHCNICEQSKCNGLTLIKRDTIVSVNDRSSNKRSSKICHTVLEQNQSNCSSEDCLKPYNNSRLKNNCSLCQQCSEFDINCEWCKENMRFKISDPNFTAQNIEKPHLESRIYWFPLTFTVSLLIMYVCIGALTYSAWKNQSFTDGAYFCFLTLTTIGSCDIFRNVFNPAQETMELLLYCMYLLIGLMLSASLVLLVQKNMQSGNNVRLHETSKSDEVAL